GLGRGPTLREPTPAPHRGRTVNRRNVVTVAGGWSSSPGGRSSSSSAAPVGGGANPEKRGRSSSISYQGALDPTKTCAQGRTPGSVSSVPSASPISSGRSRNNVTSVDPHTRQNVRSSPGDDSKRASSDSPVRQ